jgi:hyperosmotically inducible periplasmic protein
MRALMKFFLMAAAFVMLAGAAANAQSFIGGKRPANLRAMEDQIFHKILMLPNYGVFDHITYQLNGSTVVLGGSTISLGTKKGAEREVRRIPGVERVINNIEELPPSSFDDQIRRQLVARFERTGNIYRYLQGVNPPVRLVVNRGRIALEGYVDNRSDANTMNIVARGVTGAFEVENHLIVKNERLR